MQLTLPLSIPFTRPRRRPSARDEAAWKASLQPPKPRPAAGVLCRYTDADGEQWWLLGERAPRLGGTWANFGGSLEPGEHPLAGAMREFDEELSIRAADLVGSTIVAVVDDCGTDERPYTLFVIDVPAAFDNGILQWEHTDAAWWPTDEVAALSLHRGFARAWSTLVDKGVARP